jgi:hypothetical protein
MNDVIKILERVKERVSQKEYIEKYKLHERDFTRTKKISFADTVFLVLSFVKSNLDYEVRHFFGELGKSVYPSAVTTRREQISYTAFEDLLHYLSEIMPCEKKLKDYRLIAIDGMTGELPRMPELLEIYGTPGGAKYPRFHTVAAYDVLNSIFVDAIWDKYPANEQADAAKLIERGFIPKKSICVLDRGFPGITLLHSFITADQKFVMRVPVNNAYKEIKDFCESDKTDETVHIVYTKKRANNNDHKLKEMGFELPYEFDLRCIKVPLKSGETEVLMTNLDYDEFPEEEFSAIYNSRWGIETSFNYLKNAVHVESFMSIKDNSIKQEFFATLFVFSLTQLAIRQAQAIYDKKN